MKKWRHILASKDDSIISILELLDKTALQFVVMADEQDHILGTVTDGDIRRGLLKGVGLQDPVSKVMNTSPTTCLVTHPKKDIMKIMKDNDFHYLPLVDKENRIQEILNLNDINQVEVKENYVIIMAGGMGTRLAGLTSNCPKPMLKVGGKPILETIIENFKEHGFYKFIISVHYMSEVIENYFKDGKEFGVQIQYLREKQRLGTAGALSLYNATNDLPFIVMNADLLTKINFTTLLNFHMENKNAATMCLRQYEHQIPFGVVTTNNDLIIRIEEKPIRIYFVNGGIYVISASAKAHIPENTFYDMPTFLEKLIELDEKVGAFPFYDYWIDIGRIDDFEKAHLEFIEIFK
jgi:dTDP-glucose pyrophosphorylase/predicted transcriptional regulator